MFLHIRASRTGNKSIQSVQVLIGGLKCVTWAYRVSRGV